MKPLEPVRTFGYRRHSRSVGSWMFPRVGWRIYSAEKQTIRVKAWDVDEDVEIQAGGIVTIRPSTPPNVKPIDYGWNGEEYRGGSPTGIDPFGVGTILDHDRTIQRHAVGHYTLEGGSLPLGFARPGYDLVRAEYPFPKPFDGQHLVRAYRHAIQHLDDPIVRMDLAMIAFDAGLAWSSKFEAQILSMPGGQGHGACGREWAWVAYVAALAGNRALVNRMRRIARHVNQPRGLLLRNRNGSYWGSPHPWTPSAQGGSGVDPSIDVAQDLECYHTILALYAIGEHAMAEDLAYTVLKKPLRKWIACDSGLGVGSHYADLPQGWIGISAVAQHDARLAVEYAKAWPIPTPGGSQVGPFSDLKKIRKALQEWGQLGKCSPFLLATA